MARDDPGRQIDRTTFVYALAARSLTSSYCCDSLCSHFSDEGGPNVWDRGLLVTLALGIRA